MKSIYTRTYTYICILTVRGASIKVYVGHATHTLHVTRVCFVREPPQLSYSVCRKCFPIGHRNNRARVVPKIRLLYTTVDRPLLISRYRTRERFQSAAGRGSDIPERPCATRRDRNGRVRASVSADYATVRMATAAIRVSN